jgi:hypothetical protein
MLVFTFLCRAYGSGKEDNPPCDVPGFENTRMKLLRHVSFVDCPVIICFFCQFYITWVRKNISVLDRLY